MFKTPITNFAAKRVKTHRAEARATANRARLARSSIGINKNTLVSQPVVLIWCYALGAFLGSKRSVTKVVQRPTKTIKQGPSLLSLVNSALSIMALRYKVQRVVSSNIAPTSRSEPRENDTTADRTPTRPPA